MFDQEGFSISANERNRSAIVPPSALTVSHRFWVDLFSLTTGEVFASNCGSGPTRPGARPSVASLAQAPCWDERGTPFPASGREKLPSWSPNALPRGRRSIAEGS
jgi:hypothetical protein